MAAVQAARLGKSVVLIEPSRFVGGLTTGGLGATDIGNKRAIGGIAREFYGRIFTYYRDANRWKYQSRADYFQNRTINSENESSMWTFEPSVASAVFEAMLQEAKVEVVFQERLDLEGGVIKDGARIDRIFEWRMARSTLPRCSSMHLTKEI